jgi:hypothetical protein
MFVIRERLYAHPVNPGKEGELNSTNILILIVVIIILQIQVFFTCAICLFTLYLTAM